MATAPAGSISEELMQAVRAILSLLRTLVLLGGAGSLFAAANEFGGYYVDGNEAMRLLCWGLAAVAFGYLMPKISDFEEHARRTR